MRMQTASKKVVNGWAMYDMSCGSIIRHKLGMKMQSGMDYLQYVYDHDKTPHNDTVCLFAQGLRG
jgi:hypothetical protein